MWDFWLGAVGLIVVSFCQVYRLQLPSVEREDEIPLKTSVGGDACTQIPLLGRHNRRAVLISKLVVRFRHLAFKTKAHHQA